MTIILKDEFKNTNRKRKAKSQVRESLLRKGLENHKGACLHLGIRSQHPAKQKHPQTSLYHPSAAPGAQNKAKPHQALCCPKSHCTKTDSSKCPSKPRLGEGLTSLCQSLTTAEKQPPHPQWLSSSSTILLSQPWFEASASTDITKANHPFVC